MADRYVVAWCTACNQEWVEIMKNSATGDLLLLCMGCGTRWLSPKDISLQSPVAHPSPSPVESPTKEDIKIAGWTKYIIED